ncbi:MAG: Nif3-like dinuclear metal center hexameric protein [Candidatus Hermodarchaeota archaeon]
MLLREIQSMLTNKLSPKIFTLNSEIYGFQFNQKRTDRAIKRVMLTIDLSVDALHFALKNKINLIISHHGLLQNPTLKFRRELINKLTLLTKYPVAIFVLNSSFIAAEGGVSETIANALYLKLERTFDIKNDKGIKVPIGRICTPKYYLNNDHLLNLEDLINRIQTHLDLSYVSYVGDLKKIINKICIVGGDTLNLSYLRKAKARGCDCFITGRIDYFCAIFSRDIGLTLIETSHYKMEILALKKLCNVLSLEFPYVEFTLFESYDPFKTYYDFQNK